MLYNYITILFNRFSAVYEKQVFDKFQNPAAQVFGKFQNPAAQVFGKIQNLAAQVFGENKRANSSSQVEKESEHGVGGCDEK
jgi:hypothetical protein